MNLPDYVFFNNATKLRKEIKTLYAASKMIYCYSKMEKTKIVEHWYFDQEGYEKFFDEIFYPAQEVYIKQLIEDKKFGKHINGTILGD